MSSTTSKSSIERRTKGSKKVAKSSIDCGWTFDLGKRTSLANYKRISKMLLDHNTSTPLVLIDVGGIDGVVGHNLVDFGSWPTLSKSNNGRKEYIDSST